MKLELKNEANYAARYVKLTDFVDIPNADSIKHTIIYGNCVIVGKDAEIGMEGIFFPIECQISREFLSKNNQFSDKMLNADQEKVGYFNEKGRVRAVKLRKANSEGFFCSLEYVKNWLGIEISEWAKISLDTSFDTIDSKELCKKYYIRERKIQGPGGPKKKKQPSRLIPEQYRLHYDTSKLADNIHLIDPDDYIVISDKWHGTSISCGRVLLKRNLTFLEKVKHFFRFNVQLFEYENVYASRSVIKSLIADSNHYYKEDVWKASFDTIKHALSDGIQLYGEIVGYTPSGSAIQGKWNYGCKPGEFKTVIYRVTYTDSKGNVTEYPMTEVIGFCKDNNLEHVPIFYQGLARDVFPELNTENHWHQNFLQKMRQAFNLEKECLVCKNGSPAEGICIRNDTKMLNALKMKSFKFLMKETALLDKGEVDIESEEALAEEII